MKPLSVTHPTFYTQLTRQDVKKKAMVDSLEHVGWIIPELVQSCTVDVVEHERIVADREEHWKGECYLAYCRGQNDGLRVGSEDALRRVKEAIFSLHRLQPDGRSMINPNELLEALFDELGVDEVKEE